MVLLWLFSSKKINVKGECVLALAILLLKTLKRESKGKGCWFLKWAYQLYIAAQCVWLSNAAILNKK